MRDTLIFRIPALLSVLLLVPACGGSGSSSAPAAPAPGPKFARIDQDLPVGTGDSFEIVLAASGDILHAAWVDDRTGSNRPWYNRSTDGGATWMPADVPLASDGPIQASSLVLRSEGDVVCVCWEDFRNAISDVYFNRSGDGGLSWLAAEIRLDHDLPNPSASTFPRLHLAGSLVAVVWRDGDAVRLNRSIDGGLTWPNPDLRLNTASNSGADPKISGSGSTLDVIWGENGNMTTKGKLFHSRSVDGGATWPGPETDVAAAIPDDVITGGQIYASGPKICVVWEQAVFDFFQATLGHGQLYANASTDGGATWKPAPTVLSRTFAAGLVSTAPHLSGSGPYVTAVLVDPAGPFLARSEDFGQTWLGSIIPHSKSAPNYIAAPAAQGADLLVAWSDTSSSLAPDVFARFSRNGVFAWEAETTVGQGTPMISSTIVACAWVGNRPVVAWIDESGPKKDIVINRILE